MEFMLIPAIGLGGLFLITSSSSSSASGSKKEGFGGGGGGGGFLPNVDVPDRNYPPRSRTVLSPAIGGGGGEAAGMDTETEPGASTYGNTETELTSQLMQDNSYYGNAYTDKYFNQDILSSSASSASESSESYTSLTGDSVDVDYFRHNNMQPFFGSHVRGKYVAESNESVLDSYMGQGSQTFSKQTMAPMFNSEKVGMPYGAPINNDFFQSRVTASTSMANVRPFEEIRVGPGVGIGAGKQSEGGFNSGMLHRELWEEKGVDELRVQNKQKASGFLQFGHEVPDSNVKMMGAMGEMNKNRVDTHFEMGPDRLMTTTGLEKGATMHAMPVDRYVSRPETTQAYMGGASVMHPKEGVAGEYMPSKHRELGAIPVGIPGAPVNQAPASTHNYEHDYDKRVYTNNRTFREKQQQQKGGGGGEDAYFGVFGSAGIGAIVAPLMDMLRPTRKEALMVDNRLRPYTNVQQPQAKGTYMFNANESLPVTIRETTERNPNHFQIQSTNGMGMGAYQTMGVQTVHNQRETTMNRAYTGNPSAGEGTRQLRPYDAEYRQRNNDLKSSTIEGYMVQGNMSVFNHNAGVLSEETAAKGRYKESFLENKRTIQQNYPASSALSAPSQHTMGQDVRSMHTYPETYASEKLGDRNDARTVLEQLKSNPYTLDIRNAI